MGDKGAMLQQAFGRVYSKFKLHYYNISAGYMNGVISKLQDRLSEEDMETMIRILKMMDEEIMKEVPI